MRRAERQSGKRGGLQPPARPQPNNGRTAQSLPRAGRDLDSDGRCEKLFSKLELDALHMYFARHVYRDGLTFHDWLRPDGLKMIRPKVFYSIPKCTPTIVSAILTKLRENGVEVVGLSPGNKPRDQQWRKVPPGSRNR